MRGLSLHEAALLALLKGRSGLNGLLQAKGLRCAHPKKSRIAAVLSDLQLKALIRRVLPDNPWKASKRPIALRYGRDRPVPYCGLFDLTPHGRCVASVLSLRELIPARRRPHGNRLARALISNLSDLFDHQGEMRPRSPKQL